MQTIAQIYVVSSSIGRCICDTARCLLACEKVNTHEVMPTKVHYDHLARRQGTHCNLSCNRARIRVLILMYERRPSLISGCAASLHLANRSM